jgi:hypothetical protein
MTMLDATVQSAYTDAPATAIANVLGWRRTMARMKAQYSRALANRPDVASERTDRFYQRSDGVAPCVVTAPVHTRRMSPVNLRISSPAAVAWRSHITLLHLWDGAVRPSLVELRSGVRREFHTHDACL